MDSSEECYFCGNCLLHNRPMTDWVLVKGNPEAMSTHIFAICESCGDSKQEELCYLCDSNFQPYETIYIYQCNLQVCQTCQSIVEKVKDLFL